MGSRVGGRLREDDDQSVELGVSYLARSIELISLAINAACTNLNPDGTRRHIRAALEAGATREEILFVLKAGVAHVDPFVQPRRADTSRGSESGGRDAERPSTRPTTPACDAMRAVGQWNTAWDPFFELDPAWTDQFFATAIPMYKSGVMSPKEVELLSIACDASFTHMYAPGTRRHIKAALKLGATMEEIMEVLKLCVVQGVQSCNHGRADSRRGDCEVRKSEVASQRVIQNERLSFRQSHYWTADLKRLQ